MASRLNTRFILIVLGISVVLGIPALAFVYFKLNKTGVDYVNAAETLKASPDCDWEEVVRLYSRAVGHEPANVEWLKLWRDALEHVVAENQTMAVENWKWYNQINRQLAQVQQSNPEAQEEWLAFSMDRIERLGGSAEGWAALQTDANEAVTNLVDPQTQGFDADSVEELAYCRVLRYRAVATIEAMRRASTDLPIRTRNQTVKDLQRCYDAMPDDYLTATAFALWHEMESRRLRDIEFRPDDADESWARAGEVLAQFAEVRPDHPLGLMKHAQFVIIDGQRRATTPEEAAAAVDRGKEILNRAEAAARASLDIEMLRLFCNPNDTFVRVFRDEGVDRLLTLVELGLEKEPNDTVLRREQALLLQLQRRYDEAIDALQHIVDAPIPPTGLEALAIYGEKSRAISHQFDIAMDRWRQAEEGDQKDQLLEMARQYRTAYVDQSTAPEDDPGVWLMDGQIAHAEGNYPVASNKLQRVRSVTSAAPDVETLMLLADCLEKQRQEGDAERVLSEAYRMTSTSNPGVWQNLVRLRDALDMGEEACDVLESVIGSLPADHEGQTRLRTWHQEIAQRHDLEDRVGKYRAEVDPLRAALLRVQQLIEDEGHAEALGATEQALEQFPDNILLLITAAQLSNRLEDTPAAMQYLARAREIAPDDPRIRELEGIMTGTATPLDIVLARIDAQDTPEIDKVVAKAETYRQYGDPDQASEWLNRAEQMAPRHKYVIERRFVVAVGEERFDDARRWADIAAEENADQANGLLYRARLQLAEGEPSNAVLTATDAIGLNAFLTDAYRIRAQAHYETGNTQDSLEDLQRVRESRPNDLSAIKLIAQIYYEQREYEAALETVRQGLAISRDDAALREIEIGLKRRTGETEAVIEVLLEQYVDAEQSLSVGRQLVALYMQEEKNMEAAQSLLDELSAAHPNDLGVVMLIADWHGRNDDIEAGRQAFLAYIGEQDMQVAGSNPYIAFGRFLLEYGQTEAGIAAMEKAAEYQDPEVMEADILVGDELFSRSEFARAVEHYRNVADSSTAGVDSRLPATKRLIEALVREERADEAEARLASLQSMLEERDAEYYLLEASIYDAREDRPQTRRALDAAVQTEPNNHITYFNRAKYNQEDAALLSDVMNDLARTLEIQPSYRPARELRALMLQRTGDRRGAVAELAKLLEYYPDDATLRLRVAGAYLAIDRPLVAKTVLQEGADRDPDEPGWPIELGKVEYMLGDMESAQGHFREAYNRLETGGIGLLLAETLIMPGDWQDVPYAMRLLDRHAEELQQNPAYHAVLARGLAADGKTDEARLALVRSWGLNVNRSTPEPAQESAQRSRWFEAAKVVYERDYTELRRLVDEVSGGSPPPALLVSMAEYLVTTRSAPDADVEALRLVDEFRRLAAERPDIDPAVRINEVMIRGAVLFGLAQFQPLVDMYEDALENIFPSVPENGYDRWYSQRLELLNNLAYLLAERLERPDEALVYASQAAETAPDNPNILDTLGWVQHQTGDDEAARATLSQSIEIKEMPANLYHMSAVLHALGETSEARVYLNRAKRITPPSDAIRLRMLSELEQQIDAES